MAYVNVEVEGIPYCTVPTYSQDNLYPSNPLPSGYTFASCITFRENNTNIHGNTSFWAMGNSSYGIYCECVNQFTFDIKFYLNNSVIYTTSLNWGSGSSYYYVGWAFGLDSENSKGGIYQFDCYNTFLGMTYQCINVAFNSDSAFTWITQGQVIPYTWQSVHSISGKNGILNLSQIASASINNGEAVSGASASAFTSLTAQVSTMVTDDSEMSGADAGGISGSGSNSGNQSSGYAFGQGESGTNVSGGGSGYYGGEKGGSLLSGGAGSGYIGNALVSNKKMVGYNVPTSSAEATKTESVSVYSATKEANKPKAGNGFARIKMLSEVYYVFDSYNSYINNIFATIQGDTDTWTRNNDGSINGVNQHNFSNMWFSQKLKKGNATKLFVEVEATGQSSDGTDWFCCVYKPDIVNNTFKPPTSYDLLYSGEIAIEWYNHRNYAGTSPWYVLGKTLVSVDLTNIEANTEFYIGLYANQITASKVYKMYFDRQPEFVN